MVESEKGAAGHSRVQPQDAEKPEIRLALVMNGGVSLAVWMGGVTHELDLLRRASMGDAEGVAGRDLEVFGIWQRLTRDAGRRVQIDIVAGTSAGGLNGLLLATAIGRGGRLPGLKDLWIKSASLNRLLPRRSSAEEDGRSVLSGRQFEGEIREALAAIGDDQPRGEDPVTLFVTATALDGKAHRLKDSFGHAFDVRDHRRVYRFRDEPSGGEYGGIEYAKVGDQWVFRTQPYQDFGGRDAEALVRAARATAGFPAAFAPVSEDPLVRYRVHPENLATASCVTDGGVLNNAPFGPVLDEITRRRLNRPVSRVLAYIVPSRGRLADEKSVEGRCGELPPYTVLLSALNYPKEADFRSGIEDLNHRLQTSVRGTREDLFSQIVKAKDTKLENQVLDAARDLLTEYRRSRVYTLLPEMTHEHLRAESGTLIEPPAEADKHTVEAVLKLDNLWWLPKDEPGELADPKLKDWRWGVNATIRLLATLADCLHELVLPPHPSEDTLTPELKRKALGGARKITDVLRKALAVSDAALAEERMSPSVAQSVLESAELVSRVHKDLKVRETLGKLVETAAEQFVETLKDIQLQDLKQPRWTDAKQVVRVCLAVEVLTRTFASSSPAVDKLTPKFKFLRLGPDEMGPLFREDWCTSLGDRKLYGIRFKHFGGFIDEDWRRSDFAWGRLDAAHYLLPLLLREDEDAQEEIKLHTAILNAEDPPGDANLSPVQRMQDRLQTLYRQADIELIKDGPKEKVLRSVGESAIRNLINAGRMTPALRWFWRRTLKAWRRKGDQSLPGAAFQVMRHSLVAMVVTGIVLLATAITFLLLWVDS